MFGYDDVKTKSIARWKRRNSELDTKIERHQDRNKKDLFD